VEDPNASASTRGAALLGIARSWRGEHDLTRMESSYRRVIREAPAAATRAAALWELARELDEAGHRTAALQLYRRLRDGYPGSENAGDARFAIGILHWREGRRREAAMAFENARERADSDAARNRALVWLAKARMAAEDADSARSLLSEAAGAGSDDFYGIAAVALAAARTWKDAEFVPTMLEAKEGGASSSRAMETEADGPSGNVNDARATGIAETDSSAGAGAPLASLLLDLGFSEEAASILRESARSGDVPARLARAREALQGGAPRTALRIAESLRWSSEARSAPDFERLRYPIAWAWQVLEACSRSGVDPLLAYAVVRQESGFDPEAVSAAGARGLLQLMPSTAAAEAQSLGIEVAGDAGVDSVETNLLLGTHHMARLLEQFPGDLPAALAAYNANPEKARTWSAAAGDPDVFLETIGWRETRGYVKTVLRNLLRYRALYY
jgi:soluble lytic murein transglycosylase